MYRIIEKKLLNPTVVQLQVEAPLVANKARPGQFIILRVDEDGERIPLTVAGVNKEKGNSQDHLSDCWLNYKEACTEGIRRLSL